MNFQQLQNANELEIQCDQALLDVPEEKAEKVYTYINSLQQQIDELHNEVSSLEDEVDELESDNEDLQNELDEEKSFVNQHFIDLIREVVDDRWKYIVPTYDTKEKILDRLEYLLKYEV